MNHTEPLPPRAGPLTTGDGERIARDLMSGRCFSPASLALTWGIPVAVARTLFDTYQQAAFKAR